MTSCPDWQSLRGRRERQPEAWERALEHADGCELCRAAALAAEPTLLFRRLPALEVGPESVAAMKRSVASMRRAEAVRRTPRPAVPNWVRAAVVAALLLAAALMQGPARIGPEVAEVAGGTTSEVTGSAASNAAAVLAPGALEQMPLIEYVDPSHGSLIQMVDDDFSLVVVLPSQLDV